MSIYLVIKRGERSCTPCTRLGGLRCAGQRPRRTRPVVSCTPCTPLYPMGGEREERDSTFERKKRRGERGRGGGYGLGDVQGVQLTRGPVRGRVWLHITIRPGVCRGRLLPCAGAIRIYCRCTSWVPLLLVVVSRLVSDAIRSRSRSRSRSRLVLAACPCR